MQQHVHMIVWRVEEQIKPRLTHLAGDCIHCDQTISLYRR